ncbi:hypothetical protein M2272_005692 [Mycobacterium frederiksbergense]|uniref:Uncharacterized protein n=1 Tax=Mycolicibacterium frederiksbergense TaxID=117567 RepID=A0ABT6LAL6_9MYCO|nr:hypothetical protein [Mycolicibacterium frederiksbergense]MDH6199025.1 hypothetical protein [Mycolicibacterium frederiksbergense]
MASDERDVKAIEDLIVRAYDGRQPGWQTADDVARMSFEALVTEDEIARSLPSLGMLRLSGPGVTVHSAPLSDVTRILQGLQRVATAVAASAVGDTELGRQASTAVSNQTRLLISGSPAPGSLVFNISPEMSAVAEVREADGSVSMFREEKDDDQQIDKAMIRAIDVIGAGINLPPVPDDSEFLGDIAELGPRVASSIRDFARGLHRYGFDLDLEWRQPRRPTHRVHLGTHSADRIASVIESSHLDVEPVTIEGRILTVSMVQNQEWLIEQNDGTHVSIKHSDLPYDQTVGIATDARVRVIAQMKTSVSNAGVTKITYEATSVRRIDVDNS